MGACAIGQRANVLHSEIIVTKLGVTCPPVTRVS